MSGTEQAVRNGSVSATHGIRIIVGLWILMLALKCLPDTTPGMRDLVDAVMRLVNHEPPTVA